MSDAMERLKRGVQWWKRAAIISWSLLALVVIVVVAGMYLQFRQAALAMEAAESAAREAEKAAKRRSECDDARRQAEKNLAEAQDRLQKQLYAEHVRLAQTAMEQADRK